MTIDLPKYMEARAMKSGGTSYRVRLPDGRKIALGWNIDEALVRYRALMPADHADAGALSAELWVRAGRGAAARGIPFELSAADVTALVARSNGRCQVTGRRFSNEKPSGSRIRPWAASIDRKDSSKGYAPANCRLVCAFVNLALNTFGDGLFEELITGIVRRVVAEELLRHFPRVAKVPGSREMLDD